MPPGKELAGDTMGNCKWLLSVYLLTCVGVHGIQGRADKQAVAILMVAGNASSKRCSVALAEGL